MTTLEELTEEVVAFRDERDWEQFHTPQHLAAALSIEAAELQELLLWKDEQDINHDLQDPAFKTNAEDEIADILIYALLFCHTINVDPVTVIHDKLTKNRDKYPADEVRGSPKKYTDYNTL